MFNARLWVLAGRLAAGGGCLLLGCLLALPALATIECDDSQECEFLTLTDSGNIFCQSFEACEDAFIVSTLGNVYCYGNESCYRADITSYFSQYCYGYQSCRDATMRVAPGGLGDIVCSGSFSCYGTSVTLTADQQLYCQGSDSCRFSTITLSAAPGQRIDIFCQGERGCDSMALTGTVRGATVNLYCYEDFCNDVDIDFDDARDLTLNILSNDADTAINLTKINNITQITGTTPVSFEFGYYDYDGDGMPDMQFGCTTALLDCTQSGLVIDEDDDNDGVLDVDDLCHDDSGVGGSTVGGVLGAGGAHGNGDNDLDGCDDALEDTDDDNDGLSDTDEQNLYGTDPLQSDTDGDGFSDGEEVAANSDPLDAASQPQAVEIPLPWWGLLLLALALLGSGAAARRAGQ